MAGTLCWECCYRVLVDRPTTTTQLHNLKTENHTKLMEPESAIEASREAIKVCFMVGGPILAVCLIVGLLMGLVQAMSQIQDQALASVPKILTILAVVGLALPWFADRMMEFSKDQFSRPFMAEASTAWTEPTPVNSVQSLLVEPESSDDSYYPQLNAPKLQNSVTVQPASFSKPRTGLLPKHIAPQKSDPSPATGASETSNPFSLPSYRFTRRPSENIEG